MQPLLSYEKFSTITPFEKVEYLESFLSEVELSDKKHIFRFLRDIVESNENAYLKNISLSLLGHLTSEGFFTVEQILGIIQNEFFDDNSLTDRFILVKAIKFLYVFDTGSNNKTLIEKLTFHEDAEVASEAYYRLGLMELLQYPLSSETDFINTTNLARTKFDYASRIIENRIDAVYFRQLMDFLLNLLENNTSSAQSHLNEALSNIWNLKIFDYKESERYFEYQICRSLNSLFYLYKSLNQEKNWVNYQSEIQTVFHHHFDLLAKETQLNAFYNIQIENFKKSAETLLPPLYKYNLSARKGKIEVLIDQSEPNSPVYEFLQYLLEIIENQTVKKKDYTPLLTSMVRLFPNEPISDLEMQISKINFDNISDVMGFINAKIKPKQANPYRTGFPNGDEILDKLLLQIKTALPNYPLNSLSVFEIPLSEVIRYVFRSMKDPKKLFSELYADFSNKLEETFQNDLYGRLRSSNFADYYQYEPNEIGGGRLDIFFNNGVVKFPIEIKKTDDIPTHDSIKTNYIPQVQMYSAVHNQLGIFVVFDLSPKQNNKSPINDLRELFNLVNVSSYYDVSNDYPIYIVSVIVPANKVKPSSMSKYS